MRLCQEISISAVQVANVPKSLLMGSPVSAVIANLYMEIFEEQAIESAPCKP